MKTWLWFYRPDSLAHAFTPELRRSACNAFEWGMQWSHMRGGERRCQVCIERTR